MQAQEIQETLPIWAIQVAHDAGIKPLDWELAKLTPKTVTFTAGDDTQTLYKRNAWK